MKHRLTCGFVAGGLLSRKTTRPEDYSAGGLLGGGRGVERGSTVEKLYREIRSLRIYEGATEVQKLIIGREVLR